MANRAVTVADFYYRDGNGPTTAGSMVLWYIEFWNAKINKWGSIIY